MTTKPITYEISEVEKQQLASIYEWSIEKGFQFLYVRVFRQHSEDPKKSGYPFEWKWEVEWLEWTFQGKYKSGRLQSDTLIGLRKELGSYMWDDKDAPVEVEEEEGEDFL